MAEHQEPLQALFLTHAAKGQQSAEGLSCPGPSKNEHVLFTDRSTIQSTTQQLDEVGLPLPGLDRWSGSRRVNVEAERRDSEQGKDESF